MMRTLFSNVTLFAVVISALAVCHIVASSASHDAFEGASTCSVSEHQQRKGKMGMNLLQTEASKQSTRMFEEDQDEEAMAMVTSVPETLKKLWDKTKSGSWKRHDTHAMMETMRSLAKAEVEGQAKTDTSDPLTGEIIADMLKQMQEHTTHLVTVSEEDQDEVNRAHRAIVNCTAAMHASLNTKKDGALALHAKSLGLDLAHIGCREGQKVKNVTKITSCNQFQMFSTTLSPPACMASLPAEPSESVYACILKSSEFWTAANVTYAELQDACETATAELAAQKEECDNGQSSFEVGYCSYAQAQSATCEEYATCHDMSVALFEETVESVKASEKSTKGEFKAAKHVICYLNVLKADQGEKSIKLKACNENEVEVPTALAVDYPSVPDAAECKKVPAAKLPCKGEFLTKHYLSKPWADQAPAAPCTPCATNEESGDDDDDDNNDFVPGIMHGGVLPNGDPTGGLLCPKVGTEEFEAILEHCPVLYPNLKTSWYKEEDVCEIVNEMGSFKDALELCKDYALIA